VSQHCYWIGHSAYLEITLTDREGNTFNHAAANRYVHGEELSKMKPGDPIRLTGTVRRVRGDYALMVDKVGHR
jgi:hypothetical protein